MHHRPGQCDRRHEGRASARAGDNFSPRSKQLPDIPTLAESGVPGYSSVAWIVFLAPSKTPSDLIARINGDVARSFTSPELVAKTEALCFEMLASSPESAIQELRAYSTKWAQLVKERNIKIE